MYIYTVGHHAGQIQKTLARTTIPKTPIQQKLDGFGQQLSKVGQWFCVVGLATLTHHAYRDLSCTQCVPQATSHSYMPHNFGLPSHCVWWVWWRDSQVFLILYNKYPMVSMKRNLVAWPTLPDL